MLYLQELLHIMLSTIHDMTDAGKNKKLIMIIIRFALCHFHETTM